MSLTVFRGNSLKTRIVLATLAIFLVGLWSLSFFASQLLRKDMETLLSEQQLSTVTTVAAHANDELENRLRALEMAADAASFTLQQNSAALQGFLEQRPVLQSLFNGGVVVYDLNARVIADVPILAGRRGQGYMNIEVVASALRNGVSGIARPVFGKTQKSPLIGMAAPIRNAQGTIVGAMGGAVDLGAPNFLSRITEACYGKTGGYLLVAPENRLIVTATDASRVMEKLPDPGVNPLIDRFIAGVEGSTILVNPRGVEVLASAKAIPVTGWYMAAVLPTAEAFAPIRDMQIRMALATLILTVLAWGLTWWLLKRQFSPMLRTVESLAAMAEGRAPLQLLPVARQDEMGQVVGGFNALLATLGQRDAALHASEQRFRNLLQEIPSVAVQGYEPDGTTRYWNQASERLYGYSAEEAIGKNLLELIIPPEMRPGVQDAIQQMFETRQPIPSGELSLMRKDGSRVDVYSSHAYVQVPGQAPELFCVDIDLTERKRMEADQRIAAIAFESQEGIFITDAAKLIVRVNRAFSVITGYAPDEVIGRTPQLLDSGRHDAAFFATIEAGLRERGTWQGEVWSRRKSGEVFPEWLTITAVNDPGGAVTHFVATLSDITVRKIAEDEIRHLAFYDPLTGLPNRRLLVDRLEQALAASARHLREGALLYVDLDNFKNINDTLGHDIGDLLLQQVAQRLVTCVREGDTVSRLGGDEFVVMLADLSESAHEAAAQAEIVGDKILAALNEPYQLSGHECRCTPSIGVTLFSDHKETIDELLKRADMSMYQAKAAGRNTLRFFNPEMQAAITARAVLETGLRDAVKQERFRLFYQAQVDASGRVIGAEALLRWQDAERGLVFPGEFLALSEESGLILPIGQWVLDTACDQLALWAQTPALEPLTLAVNVSARQFRLFEFVDLVRAALLRSGANPYRLRLELTENLLEGSLDDTIVKMDALKELGIGFSLDDFGTGFSSLSYLKRFPLDQLKIDRSFVRDILFDSNDAAIAKMIIALGESMGLAVLAEGVEDSEQRDFLARHGCRFYQGNLFSRPLPVGAFEAFLRLV